MCLHSDLKAQTFKNSSSLTARENQLNKRKGPPNGVRELEIKPRTGIKKCILYNLNEHKDFENAITFLEILFPRIRGTMTLFLGNLPVDYRVFELHCHVTRYL